MPGNEYYSQCGPRRLRTWCITAITVACDTQMTDYSIHGVSNQQTYRLESNTSTAILAVAIRLKPAVFPKELLSMRLGWHARQLDYILPVGWLLYYVYIYIFTVYIYIYILVGGLEHSILFRILGRIIPIDWLLFFRRGWNHQPVYIYIYIYYVHHNMTGNWPSR